MPKDLIFLNNLDVKENLDKSSSDCKLNITLFIYFLLKTPKFILLF